MAFPECHESFDTTKQLFLSNSRHGKLTPWDYLGKLFIQIPVISVLNHLSAHPNLTKRTYLYTYLYQEQSHHSMLPSIFLLGNKECLSLWWKQKAEELGSYDHTRYWHSPYIYLSPISLFFWRKLVQDLNDLIQEYILLVSL